MKLLKEMSLDSNRMKGSDSTNSLTELTGRDECFICLSVENDKEEPLVSSKLLRTCGCKFFVHPECWNEWIKGKTDYDRPICRRQSVYRVNIPPNPVYLVEMPEEPRRARRITPFRVACVLLVLGFAAGFIFSIVFNKN